METRGPARTSHFFEVKSAAMRLPGIVSRRGVLLSAASAIVGDWVTRAQTPQPAANPTFSADVKVFNVFVTVRDKNGNIVKDLAKEDFTLRARNEITYAESQCSLGCSV
jgi:hypothetical protein